MFAINVFNKLILDNHIDFSSKMKIYNAVSWANMWYGARVWGYKSYDNVEIPLKYFFNKWFNIIKNTTDYIIYLLLLNEQKLYIYIYIYLDHVSILKTALPILMKQTLLRSSGDETAGSGPRHNSSQLIFS